MATNARPPKKRPDSPVEGAVKFTVYLDRDTHQALRIASIEDRVTSTRLVEGLVRAYLASRKKKGGRS